MLNYVIEDGGDRSYDPGVDDLGVDNTSGKSLKPLIRDFLADVTSQNDYPIAPGGNDIVLTTPEGDPVPLAAAESTGAVRVFVESNDLQEYSDSGKLTRYTGATGFVDKTRGTGGNELLPSVKGTGLDTTGATTVETTSGDKIPAVVSSMLQKENKYSSGTGQQFAAKGTQSSDMDQRTLTIPEALGKYSTTGNQVSFDELRKIGTSLLLKAAQIDNASTPEKSVRVDTATSLSAEALSPTDVFNSRKRIDTKLFEATRADGSASSFVGRNSQFLVDSSGEGQASYGTMNSPITPFDGPFPAGMMAQAAVGIGVVGGGALVISTVLSLLPFVRRENPVRGPFLSGRSDVPTLVGAIAEMTGVSTTALGLIPTKNPYIDCVKAGTLSFFGAGGGDVSSITGLAGSVLQSPGFYVVIVRAILRSIVELENSLKGFNSSGLSLSNLSAAVNFIDTLRRSKLIGYLNALAAIGDPILDNSSAGFFSLSSFGATSSKLPDPTFPANRVMLSREGASPTAGLGTLGDDYKTVYTGPQGRLAWRMGSAPAAFLIPKTVFQGELGISPTESPVMRSNIINSSMLNTSGRLPKDIVTDIESLLDAEYVPFYFHDLRTNEIVGFHAFLDSLDDSFNVETNTEKAFGRLDGVKVYGGTTRSISFGFVIAATSESDFDEMWFRINKLVTLVYPQWTPGDEVVGAPRPRADKKGSWSPKYKVPFSQVVGSSPLVRVRIGDVIGSNYSKFGLSRFFGATDNETILSRPEQLYKRGINARDTRFDSEEMQGKKTDDRYYPPGSKKSRHLSKIEEIVDEEAVVLKPSMGKNYTLVGLAGTSIPVKTYFPIKGKISNTSLGKSYISQKAIDGFKGLAKDAPPLLYIDVEVTDERYVGDLQGKTLRVTRQDFTYDTDDGPGVAVGLMSSQIKEELPEDASFFDPSTNAVVRAFESTQGKGIAGMITSLKFTWLDANNTWEITRGSRAPQWCKVSISMDVIHDLPLGMGHDGFMIAPAYPVGNINRRFFGTVYTSPSEKYDVPIKDGNDDLRLSSKDPRVLDGFVLTPDEIKSAVNNVINKVKGP